MSDLFDSIRDVKSYIEMKGFLFILKYVLRIIVYRNWLYKKYRKDWKFTFDDEKYKYFHHLYNTTWENERAVEIPIIKKIFDNYRENRILEVGNVLSHYFDLNHDVIDKYEMNPEIINMDIIDYNPQKNYELIISISTLEHIGYDEKPRKPRKIFRVINHLKKLLASKGKMIVTIPIGYNPYLDYYLKNNLIKFDQTFFLKRISKDNRWKQVKNINIIIDAEFGEPFPNANGLFIGCIKKT
ncbi:MAG: hypothetical protein BAJALOKI3v1_480012 [Promethearchaeota archaeon]|nr:MAG: hypothetical protein BAJALOKI3v1_480012 [Candidatus Lokiarchaeota archaeon]